MCKQWRDGFHQTGHLVKGKIQYTMQSIRLAANFQTDVKDFVGIGLCMQHMHALHVLPVPVWTFSRYSSFIPQSRNIHLGNVWLG